MYFRTLLTTISTPFKTQQSVAKPQITTTLRALQNEMSTGTPNQSMIGGHAQWVKGMVNEKIGQATGSEEWKASGRADMMEGTGAMKQAHAERGPPNPGSATGKIEEAAGKATGCPGMVKEGVERQAKDQ